MSDSEQVQECHNCVYRNVDASGEPCLSCVMSVGVWPNWEPVTARNCGVCGKAIPECELNEIC